VNAPTAIPKPGKAVLNLFKRLNWPSYLQASLLAQGFDIFIWDVLILLVKILNIEIFIGEFFGGNIHTATK
jgi:hypothetical protein